jgi:hypothetical protein
MRRQTFWCALAACCKLMAEAAQAQMFDCGAGLLCVDVLNLTWLRDASYAKSRVYDEVTPMQPVPFLQSLP